MQEGEGRDGKWRGEGIEVGKKIKGKRWEGDSKKRAREISQSSCNHQFAMLIIVNLLSMRNCIVTM